MGSQTLEILRQGIWASLSGGYFFDPHKNTFSNALHLYLYLVLLCTPFVTYLYSPATLTAWIVYCAFVVVLMAALKVINLEMHRMYDRAQILSDPKASVSHKAAAAAAASAGVGDDDVGIEMQILSTAEYPDPGSAQSAISFDPGSVTGPSTGIDFKVDVHRKNSSDSSDSVVYGAQQEDTTTTGWTASGKKRPIAVVEKENITEAVVVTEAGTSSSKSRDGGQVRKSSKRSNKKRRAEEEQSTENKSKKEGENRKTSSSSDSRNSNSSEGSSHGDSSSSSTTSSSNGRNDGIYKYDSSGSSSSSSARFSTLKSGNTNAGGEGHSGWGVEPDTKSRKGAKGSDIKSDQSKKRRKKNSHPVTSEGIVADPLASSTSLPPERVIEMEDLQQLDPLQDNSVVSSSSGAKKKRLPSARLQRQISLDTDEIDLVEHLYFSMLHDDQRQRHHHRSTDSEETCTNTSNISLGNASSANQHHHLHYQYGMRPPFAYYTTKSELAIGEHLPPSSSSSGKLFLMQPSTPSMRKDSNSTMSAIQLPIATSSMATSNSCKIRRLSSGGAQAAGSKGVGPAGATGRVDSPGATVRRIKSAALDTSHAPVASYVSTQPNSVETIAGGRTCSALPPPSKSLSRNPHLNLYPKKQHSSHSSVAGDQPVYPIAEHEVDEVVTGIGGRMINHPLLNIRLPTSSSEEEEEENCQKRNSANKQQQPKSDPTDVRLEIEESSSDPEEEEEEEEEEDEYVDLEMEKSLPGEENSDGVTSPSAAAGTARGNLVATAATTDSETENNGSQSPLLECGLKSTSSNGNGRSGNRIVIVETGKLTGTVTTNGTSGANQTKNKLAINGGSSATTVDETSAAGKLRSKSGAVPVRAKNKRGGKGHESSDWNYGSASSKDMLLTVAGKGVESPEPGPSDTTSSTRRRRRRRKTGTATMMGEREEEEEVDEEGAAAKDRNGGTAELEEDEEQLKDSHYVYMKPIFQNPRRLESLPQPLLEAQLAAEMRRNVAREFRERVAPLTRGRAFRYHFQGGGGGSGGSGSQVSAGGGMVPLSTFFKQLTPSGEDQVLPTSSSMEFNAFGDCSTGTRWRLTQASPFVRNMTTRSARYSNTRRGRRTTSFEGTASSSRDDFDHVASVGAVPGATSATSVGGGGGLDSEFGSGTIGGGSIDTYTGIIEKMLSSSTQGQVQDIRGGSGTGIVGGNAAAFHRVEDAMMDYIRYIKNAKQMAPKKYYKLPLGCCGWRREWKVSMDRLQLLALFDRDAGWFQVLLAIVLTAFVATLGSMILQMGFYADILAFVFCFVMAGSQYSLLKSVQPDAASPIHGFNKMVAFSRPIYFCLCAGMLIGVHKLVGASGEVEALPALRAVELFGVSVHGRTFFEALRYGLATVLLFFPLLFSLGLFPQINTFLVYALEQLDMHVFGGNAVCGLLAGLVGLIKSILACFILYGLAYGGVIEPKGTQHISFSIFSAAIVPIAYHMSRCASDFTNIWTLIKSSIVMIHSEEEVDKEEEIVDGQQQQPTKRSRSESEEKLKDGQEASEGQSLGIGAGKSTISLQPFPMTATNSQISVGESATSAMHLSPQLASEVAPPVGGGVVGPTPRSDSTATNSSVSYMLRDGDPLPRKLQKTVNARLRHDLLVCIFMSLGVMALHCSTIFTVLQPEVNPALHTLAVVLGFVLHYVIPQMRKQWPWLCVAKPILRAADFGHFEAKEATKVSWFESMYVYLCFLERNVLYPVLFLSALTGDSPRIVTKFGPLLGSAIIVVCGLKGLRNAYSDTASQFMVVIFTVLFFQIDAQSASETFLVDFFLMSILYRKISEFLLKLQFIVTYIAPWQITWGSAFHAFAQPFSVPHSAMLFVQAGISAVFSTPLNPFLGSAIFITSYVRPIKFWERDYNTRRIDHSNTRLSLQLERDLGADDNNLNSIFYEHLTQSLQHSLCGDLIMGRWGQVSQGDCFVLASDYLNCLVHIIELGNGLCTFQIRGLEFRGTYCQQREVEAISEGIEDNIDCCCCAPGHIKNMLSVNAMFSARWLAWQVVAAQYVIEGYSISDNSATTLLTVYEFRRALITYYVKSVIFFVIRSGKLDHWLKSEAIQETLQMTVDPQFVDLDPAFNQHLDEDFDSRVSGITRSSFCGIYLEWIKYCYEMRRKESAEKEDAKKAKKTATGEEDNPNKTDAGTTAGGGDRSKNIDVSELVFEAIEKPLVSLCFALTLLARRTLATASHGRQYSNFEFFLHGLHALFKGDFRITSPRDEWVFADMDLLHTVVAPAVRMSLKLHQDYFQNPEQFEDITQLYTTICYIASEIVISHEADPAWRSAVLRGVSNLLALRHVNDDGGDEYRIIRLTKGFLSFRVIKLNRECVRGLWSGQQQELIYLRNRNPERGSIQNAKQALRNIINSSCDQPIGYPIYVSPLTTSYAETNEQLCRVIGGPASFEKMRQMFLDLCRRIRNRCREGCSSGSSLDCGDMQLGDMQGVYCAPSSHTASNTLATIGSGQLGGGGAYGSQSLSLVGIGGGAGGIAGGLGASVGGLTGSAATTRGSLASMGKPSYNNSSLAGFLRGSGERDMDRESGGRSSGKRDAGGSKRSHAGESRSERRATLPASTSNLNSVTSKSEMVMMMGVSSASAHGAAGGASGSGVGGGGGARGEGTATTESSSLSSSNFLSSIGRVPNRKSLSFESKRGPGAGAAAAGGSSLSADRPNTTSSELSLPFTMPSIGLHRKVIIVDEGEIYDCLDLGRRIDINWPNDEMRSCGGRSSWRDWTPQVGMTGYVVHYWQPNHPDVFYRSNVNRTLLLLQIGNHFVPVGENGVKEYNGGATTEGVRGQAASAENLNGLTRRGRSRSKKLSDSIRKLRSEEDPVLPSVLLLPEEEVVAKEVEEQRTREAVEEAVKEVEKEEVVNVVEEVKSEQGPVNEDWAEDLARLDALFDSKFS